VQPGPPAMEKLDDRICSGQLLDDIYYTVLDGQPCALRASDGTLLWRASEDDAAEGGPLLDPASMLSPPVVQDQVHCVVNRKRQEAESFLATFDRATGRLLRRTFLCSHNSPDLLGIGSQPAVPAIEADAVFCLTNIGAIAAVDRFDNAVRWIYRYNFLAPVLKKRSIKRSDRWANGPVVVADGRVFAAPQDSDYAIALDARTGELLWAQPRDGWRYLAGVANSMVLVSGETAAGIDAASGKLIWQTPPFEGDPAGRPVAAADGLLVPTTVALYKVDPATGNCSQLYRWEGRGRPGNLAVVNGSLLVAWAQGLDLIEPWAQTLERENGKPPGEWTAVELFDLGAISRRRGDLLRALDLLSRAARSSLPGSDLDKNIRSELFALHFEQARKAQQARRWQDAANEFQQAAQTAPDTPRQIDALVARANAHEKLDQWDQAVDVYQKLIADFPAQVHSLENGLPVRCDWFGQSRIARILSKHGPKPYARHEAAAAELLAQGTGNDRSPWLAVLSQYPNSAAAGQARLRLAESYLGEPNKAIHHFKQFLSEWPGSPETADVLWRLSQIYLMQQRPEEAAAALRRLKNEFPDAKLPGKDLIAGTLAERELSRP